MKVALLSFAHVHAGSYASLLSDWPGVELLTTDPGGAAAPPGELRGRALADHLGVAYADTYDDALAWQPDAVVVCAENSRHRDLTERAAAAGAHVLCEKPLATTAADAEAMIEACERAGTFLMTAYPVRFSTEFAALKSLHASGRLGTVLSATGTNNGHIPIGERAWFTQPELSGGGALVDHVVHVADLLDALLEQPAVEVRAVTNRILHADQPINGVETGGLVAVTYADGTIATIDCSWSHPSSAPNWGGLTLQVVGTEGVADIDPFGTHVGGFAGGGPAWLSLGADLDRAMLAHFLDGVRSGHAPQPDGAAGLRTLRIVLAAQESARAGTVVPIPQLTP
ncbi:Gfo/Idh/MocA family protein [Jiangella sp. DSM 45060]|uniref:Gfo/Idh/MocA family protein n=1 Tax=Jiangella sp. DSM 45060 TaxID=1798224 RepID=UPI00087BCF96|nr:Gfo/Idh/MocA family oxidoreductase [Jiangella sp. DSM 45060]SDT32432.1 Predicted dehydrogenase [Jiangella sp. DSM 45060]